MKTATLPTVRVQPQTREQAESLLEDGETLSMFIDESLRRQIAFRQAEREFLARGIASIEKAKKSGRYISADKAVSGLRTIQKRKLKNAA
jgi:hypothetical protein